MLADLDSSLGAWLAAALPARTGIDFGSPDELAADRARRPLINLFLHSVNEDTAGLVAAGVRLRDPDGRVRTVQPPTRRYVVTYQVTAWAGDAAEEHRLLGAVLIAHAGRDTIDGDCLHGLLGMASTELPISIGAAHSEPERIGAPRRTSLWLTVAVPLFPEPVAETAPPVTALDLVAHSTSSAPNPAPPPQPRRRWQRTSRIEPAAPRREPP